MMQDKESTPIATGDSWVAYCVSEGVTDEEGVLEHFHESESVKQALLAASKLESPIFPPILINMEAHTVFYSRCTLLSAHSCPPCPSADPRRLLFSFLEFLEFQSKTGLELAFRDDITLYNTKSGGIFFLYDFDSRTTYNYFEAIESILARLNVKISGGSSKIEDFVASYERALDSPEFADLRCNEDSYNTVCVPDLVDAEIANLHAAVGEIFTEASGAQIDIESCCCICLNGGVLSGEAAKLAEDVLSLLCDE